MRKESTLDVHRSSEGTRPLVPRAEVPGHEANRQPASTLQQWLFEDARIQWADIVAGLLIGIAMWWAFLSELSSIEMTLHSSFDACRQASLHQLSDSVNLPDLTNSLIGSGVLIAVRAWTYC